MAQAVEGNGKSQVSSFQTRTYRNPTSRCLSVHEPLDSVGRVRATTCHSFRRFLRRLRFSRRERSSIRARASLLAVRPDFWLRLAFAFRQSRVFEGGGSG